MDELETPAVTEVPTEDESNKLETGKEDAAIEGNVQVSLTESTVQPYMSNECGTLL